MERCGNPDITKATKRKKSSLLTEQGAIRQKRFVLANTIKWGRRELTYKISSNSTSQELAKKPEEIELQIKKALNVWSEVAKVYFRLAQDGEETDIEFRFVKEHNDELPPFEGPNSDLAHAFFPDLHKGIHFNDYIDFTIDANGKGVDIYQLAVHEIGHALGIHHNPNKLSIMYPIFSYRSD